MAPTRMNKIPDACRERAVSEVIGSIMLISVVVIAVAVVGVVLTSQGTPQKVPALDAVISNFGNTIQIYHNGGDTLQRADMELLVDGWEKNFSKGSDPSWTSWSAGDSLVYKVPDGQPMPQIVNIVFKSAGASAVLTTADFSPGGMMNSGPIITNTLNAAFTGSPSSGTAPLVVQFTDLSTGSPVGWSWSFGDTQTSTLQNPTHVYNTEGSYTVTLLVTNFTSSTSSISHPITVTPNAPSVISISPISGTRGTNNIPISVYGTGFINGATISLKKSGSTDIGVSSVVFGSATTLTGTLSIPAGSTIGAWNVVVTNPDTQAATLTNGFTITDPAGPPTVTSTTPNTGATGSTVFITNLAGTGFQTGAQVKLNSSSTADISAANITVVNPTQITCTFYLSGAATGARNVVVTNPDGQVGMQTSGFTVTSTSAPTVTTITPNSGTKGSTVSITDLAGTNFQNGATVKLNSSTLGADIPAAGVTVVNSAQITCTFYLTGAAAGTWNVVVTNPDGQAGMKTSAFTVNVAPVTADFTGTPTSGNIPLTVQFLDASTGSPTTWAWNFGDAGTSNLQNPSHIYSTADIRTVSLTVGNGTGTNTMTKTNYITANTPATPLSFYDNFDSGFSGWTTTGTVTRITTGTPRNGVASIRMAGGATTPQMQQTISTAGNSGITVSYLLGTSNNLDAGEYFVAEWYDGTTWTLLGGIYNGDATENGVFYYYQYTLPTAANNPSFALQFRLNANGNTEYGYVDDVRVTGIPT